MYRSVLRFMVFDSVDIVSHIFSVQHYSVLKITKSTHYRVLQSNQETFKFWRRSNQNSSILEDQYSSELGMSGY